MAARKQKAKPLTLREAKKRIEELEERARLAAAVKQEERARLLEALGIDGIMARVDDLESRIDDVESRFGW